MTWDRLPAGYVVCVRCGSQAIKRSAHQKYCKTCSQDADIERKRKWARQNPGSRTPAQLQAARQELFAARKEAGQTLSEGRAISWMADNQPGLTRGFRVAWPFSTRLSKNYIWRNTAQGHVFLREEARAEREALIAMLRIGASAMGFVENKVWLDVLVQKPNHRLDAVNVLNEICDAVKVAIDVDDRWFCVRRLDWEIVKEDPKIYIGVFQEDVAPVRVCSDCGRLLGHQEFQRNRSARDGIGRTCRDCARVARQLRAQRRAANQ